MESQQIMRLEIPRAANFSAGKLRTLHQQMKSTIQEEKSTIQEDGNGALGSIHHDRCCISVSCISDHFTLCQWYYNNLV